MSESLKPYSSQIYKLSPNTQAWVIRLPAQAIKKTVILQCTPTDPAAGDERG